MHSTGFTPIDEIFKIHNNLRDTFRSGLTRPIEWRRNQLHQLEIFVKENSDALAECLRLDLGRPKQEAMTGDLSPSLDKIQINASKLDEWNRPTEPSVSSWQQSWKPRVEKYPKGVVLIVVPWNYPIILTMQPLCGAIAAGCCAIIKPSEIGPCYSSFLAQNLNKYLDASAYRVVLGGVPEMTKVLDLKWDHIIYTGNGRVGRIVAAAASKHLTPLTLELGGKSPVLVDSTAEISIAAKRILWGKINNSGQICVAPDYVIAERSIIPALVESLKHHYASFFPEGALESKSYGRIVSDAHFERLKTLIKTTKGEIVLGGKWEQNKGRRGIEPTVVINIQKDDVLLQDEIFGPILPILAVDSIDEAIAYVKNRDSPLVVYAFTNMESTKQKIITETVSGNVWFGDTFLPIAVSQLPFGGVGESGCKSSLTNIPWQVWGLDKISFDEDGRQSLKFSFEECVYERSIVDVPFQDEPFMSSRYPPYTKARL